MKYVYSDRVSGECKSCRQQTLGGGYLTLDANGTVTGVLCQKCKDSGDVENNKTVAITVKKLEGGFVRLILKQELYQVVSVKNMVIPHNVITGEELNRYVNNSNISVTIKH